jgi:hypothetical protein
MFALASVVSSLPFPLLKDLQVFLEQVEVGLTTATERLD